MKKRLCIYATYDKHGNIEEYVEYCLEQISKVVSNLFVVSNSGLNRNAREKLYMANRIYERSDEGYDMGGFAHVICDLLEKNELWQYDELILLNDSIFGPFYSLADMFSKMDKNEMLDFWGITKRGISDFDGGEYIYPEHIQLYFYVVRKRMLQSEEFASYWNTISEKVTDFRSAIINYEFAFTQYFKERGYKWDVYCHVEAYDTDQIRLNLSPYHYASYELIKEKKCPFMKRKMCTGDFVSAEYCDKSNIRKAMAYIDKHTEYDIDLIWKHILKSYHMEDILEGLQLYQVLEEEIVKEDKSTELIRVIEIGAGVSEGGVFKQGEHVPPYTLVIDFRNLEDIEPLKQARMRCVIDNLFPHEGYASQIVQLFEDAPRLGMLIPPLMTFGKLAYSLMHRWENDEVASRLYQSNDLHVPFKKDKAPTHKIDGFLCRSELLNENILEILGREDGQIMMQMMPLIAQEKGYYTEILINKDYVSCYVSNLRNVAGDLWKSLGMDTEDDMDLRHMKDLIFRKKVLEFYRKHKKIFIYGAGQLAYRIIRIMQTVGQIEGVVVSDLTSNESVLGEYKVQCINDINVAQSSFIIAVGEKHNKDVIDKLLQMGMEDYLILN